MTTTLRSLIFIITTFLSASALSQGFIFSDPVSGLPTTAYTLTPTLCQGASVDHCITVTSAGTTHTITGSAGSAGTIVVAPPSNPSPRCFRYTAPFSFTGPNTITFTLTNNLGQTGTIQITIIVVNPNTPINQNFVYKITRTPVQNMSTPTATPMGHTGVWSNGVSVFNAKDGMSYNNAGVWNRNAYYYEAISFDIFCRPII